MSLIRNSLKKVYILGNKTLSLSGSPVPALKNKMIIGYEIGATPTTLPYFTYVKLGSDGYSDNYEYTYTRDLNKLVALNLSYAMNAKYIDITNLEQKYITSGGIIFAIHTLLDVYGFNPYNATDLSDCFGSCTNLVHGFYSGQADTSKVLNFDGMFAVCSTIQEIPAFDTKNGRSFRNTFAACKKIDTIPQFDTSSATDMSQMFYECNNLRTIPLLNTTNVKSMFRMFFNCTKLSTVPLLDLSNCTDLRYMFSGCTNLTSIPAFTLAKSADMSYMFENCSALTEFPAIDVSNVSKLTHMFDGCTSLTSIKMYGMKTSFQINDTALDHDAIMSIINNLPTIPSGNATFSMGSTKLALLRYSEKEIATKKGWNLA